MLTHDRGIAFRGVAFSRKDARGEDIPVFRQLNAVFECGRVSMIQGAVGVGKSTLLHLAAGLMRPQAGEILAHGIPVSRYSASFRDNWRKKVGIVFQHLKLFGPLTVSENLSIPLIPRSKSAIASARNQYASLLDQLNISRAANRPVRTLSGGERQRVAVARAMVGDPDFIFADEPFSHQDSEGAARIHQLFCHAARRNKTVLVVAHELPPDLKIDLVRHFCLDNGHLAPTASPSHGEYPTATAPNSGRSAPPK